MITISNDDGALAGEYVLGLLDAGSQAQAVARIATDTDFAAEVAAWEARLSPLLGDTAQSPPDHLWGAIAARIVPVAAQDRAPVGLRVWQAMTLLSSSVAAVLAVMLFAQPLPTASPAGQTAPMLAALASESGPSAVAVSYDRSTGLMILTPVALKTGTLAPELWVIPADGVPRSLGIIKTGTPSGHTLSADLQKLLALGVTLAITPEPQGGSPTGKPTGAIIASGKVTTL